MRYYEFLQARKPASTDKSHTAIQAKGNTLYIYDFIDKYAVNAADVSKWLNSVDGDVIVRIASVGGDVWEGLAIYNIIAERARKDNVTVVVDSIAASIASMIALAGTDLYMNSGSQMMIHLPWTFAAGNANDMRAAAAVLDKAWQDTMRDAYVKAMGKTDEEMDAIATAETWYSAEELVAADVAAGIWQGEENSPAAKLTASLALRAAASVRNESATTSLHAEVLPHATKPRANAGAVKLSTAVRLTQTDRGNF